MSDVIEKIGVEFDGELSPVYFGYTTTADVLITPFAKSVEHVAEFMTNEVIYGDAYADWLEEASRRATSESLFNLDGQMVGRVGFALNKLAEGRDIAVVDKVSMYRLDNFFDLILEVSQVWHPVIMGESVAALVTHQRLVKELMEYVEETKSEAALFSFIQENIAFPVYSDAAISHIYNMPRSIHKYPYMRIRRTVAESAFRMKTRAALVELGEMAADNDPVAMRITELLSPLADVPIDPAA